MMTPSQLQFLKPSQPQLQRMDLRSLTLKRKTQSSTSGTTTNNCQTPLHTRLSPSGKCIQTLSPFPNIVSTVPQSPLPLVPQVKQEEEHDSLHSSTCSHNNCLTRPELTPFSRYVQTQRGDDKMSTSSQVYIQRMRRIEMLRREENLRRNVVKLLNTTKGTMSVEQISVTFDEDLSSVLPVASNQNQPLTMKLSPDSSSIISDVSQSSQHSTNTIPTLETTFVCDRKKNICQIIRKIRARHYRSFFNLTPSQKSAWITLNHLLKTQH
ncbi:hypothetical protein FDP41_007381 [Naegleria fowleri]|uniref:Uncharacterized protein n=1 Tax=Naegleria fowleri TaxID=5763 RepID=A0A6A5CCC2_NAEFO|nr:uncharacterized protein FDP41_007381 [Naegleria fowleri]KAF0984204.1 hypothetical protein FDP41_007381 [Naegleria fowleri]CAG4709971.1 unnamed protein product [Naegleria fowleri]